MKISAHNINNFTSNGNNKQASGGMYIPIDMYRCVFGKT